MTAETTTVGTLSVTWHSHADRWQRAWVGRDVPWWQVAERLTGEVADFLEAKWAMWGEPASEFNGMLIRIDGLLVGVVETVGIDAIDRIDAALLIDWVWPMTVIDGAVTVGQVAAGVRAGTI